MELAVDSKSVIGYIYSDSATNPAQTRSQAMKSILEKALKTLTKNTNVKVFFKGDAAYTTGTAIYLPALPTKAQTPEVVAKVRGLGDHETAHVLYSDFGILKTLDNEAIKNVLNLVEDIRVERDIRKIYPGANPNIQAAMDVMIAEHPVAEKPHILLKTWVELMRNVLGRTVKAPDFKADVVGVFGADLFDKVRNLPHGKPGTAKALELALEMMTKFEQKKEAPKALDNGQGEGGGEGEKEERKGQPSRGENANEADEAQGDEEGAGEEGAGSGQGEEGDGEGQDEGSEPGMGQGEGEGDEGQENEAVAEGQGQEEGDGEGMGQGEGQGDNPADGEFTGEAQEGEEQEGEGGGIGASGLPGYCTAEDLGDEVELPFEAIKRQLSELHNEALQAREYIVHDDTRDCFMKLSENPAGVRVYNELKDGLGKLNVNKAQFAKIFESERQAKWLGDREEGKLNARTLATIKMGNRRVFKTRIAKTEVNTAASFLVDFSGSMARGSALATAMKAVVLFLETLAMTKVQTEVLGFTTGDVTDIRAGYQYGRAEALVTYILKEFGEAFGSKVKSRIGNYGMATMRNNADPDSLLIAYRRLKTRPEKRKILFVLSDGQPACWPSNDSIHGELKRVTKIIENDPEVELFAIGLGFDGVAEYYKNCLTVDSANLVPSLFAELKKRLRG